LAGERPDAVDRAVAEKYGWAGPITVFLGGCIAHKLAQPSQTNNTKQIRLAGLG